MPSIRTVIFLRHGEAEGAQPGAFFGRTDTALTENGRRQAAAAAARLQRMKVDAVCAGPLLRCVQTARLLKLAAPLETEPGLNEMDFGDWEGKLERDCRADAAAWAQFSGSLDGAPPQGESLNAFHARVLDAYNALLDRTEDKKVLLIVAHQSVIRAIVADALGMGAAGAFHFRCAPGSLSSLDYVDGYASLSRWNA